MIGAPCFDASPTWGGGEGEASASFDARRGRCRAAKSVCFRFLLIHYRPYNFTREQITYAARQMARFGRRDWRRLLLGEDYYFII